MKTAVISRISIGRIKRQILAMLASTALTIGTAAMPAHAGQTIIHSFSGGTSDGANPYAGLAMDSSGNFYGAAFAAGSAGAGVLFKISSGTYSVLYNFPGSATLKGSGPTATPLLYPSASPTIYGTTEYSTYSSSSGNAGNGVIYSVSTGGVGYTVLHPFGGGTSDGANPWSGLTPDSSGTYLYGTTPAGGAHSDGTFYRQAIASSTYATQRSFQGGSTDASTPYGGVIFDSTNTNLLGASNLGGSSNAGVTYSITVIAQALPVTRQRELGFRRA